MLQNRFAIVADRLQAMGYGERQPIATNATAEGRETNRRIVAVLQVEQISAVNWDDSAELFAEPKAHCTVSDNTHRL